VDANAHRAFDALGDPTRRQLLERLSKRSLAVGELASGLPISRPAVSQHLKVLKEARLVSERVEGTRHIYSLDPRGVAAMRNHLDRLWDRSLAAFKEAAEKERDP